MLAWPQGQEFGSNFPCVGGGDKIKETDFGQREGEKALDRAVARAGQ